MYSVVDDYPESPGESEESIVEESIENDSGFRQERASNARGFDNRHETTRERQRSWALKTFTSWCTSEGFTEPLLSLAPWQLNNLLKKFYKEAKRRDGCEFSKAGFKTIRMFLDRYFKSKCNFSIVKTSEFVEANKAFEEKLNLLGQAESSPWRQSASISPQDLKTLVQSGVFGGSTPTQLLNTCWFNIVMHFDVGDHIKQRKLSKQQFVIHSDNSGQEFVKLISFPGNNTSVRTMQSIPGHPLCPVSLLKKYLSKLHPEFDALFQCPVRHAVDESIPVWYEKQAVGVHALEGMMAGISRSAGLSRIYSNRSLPKSSSLVYMQCGLGYSPPAIPPSVATGSHGILSKSEPARSLSLASAVASYSQSPRVSSVRSLSLPGTQSFALLEEGDNELLESPSAMSTSSLHSESGCSSQGNQSPLIPKSPVFALPTKSSLQHSHCIQGPLLSHEATPSPMSMQTRTAIGVCMPTVKVESSGQSSTSCERMGVQPTFPSESLDLPSLSESLETSRGISSDRHTVVQPVRDPPSDLHRKTYLHLVVQGGSSFMDLEGHGSASDGSILLHLHFRGQRFRSQPVPYQADPDIHEEFYLEVLNSHTTDPNQLLTISDAIHVVISKTDSSGLHSLIGSHYFDWRAVLKEPSSQLSCNNDVYGFGEENKMLMGSLRLKLRLLPQQFQTISSGILERQNTMVLNRDRQFMSYAKQWWKEYLALSSSQTRGLVKIFTPDESDTSRPVVSFLRPLWSDWVIDTPRHAARFVSLLPLEDDCSMFGTNVDRWSRLHAILCRGKGSVADHCVLLCSLLLGFGLDAYVCLGTKQGGQSHAWVMTRRHDGKVIFWESLTGQRLVLDDDPGEGCQHYKSIGCVFSNTAFHANIQANGLVRECNWDLDDTSSWKAMSREAIACICGPDIEPSLAIPPRLLPSTIDVSQVSEAFEEEMKGLIQDHRQILHLPTNWDDVFSHMLSPCLTAYEMEAQAGLTLDMEELKGPIKRSLGDTHSFVSVTATFNHRAASEAFQQIKSAPEYQDVIDCRQDHVTFALRVKLFPYPEELCAVRLIVAAKFPVRNNGHVTQEWKVIDPLSNFP